MVTHRWAVISAIVALAMAFGVLAQAEQIDDSPYYVVFKTWAVAEVPLETGLKLVSFLPRRYLLYIMDREKREKWYGEEYLRAVTQDGATVLVDPDSVSRSTFRQRIGSHEVIFNSEFLLCKERGCRPSDVTVWPIDRGDAFHIQETDDGFHKLEGQRDEPFHGYITVSDLKDLEERGRITRADAPHPRYRVEKRRASTLATECGDERSVNDIFPLKPEDDASPIVLELLKFAQVDGDRVKVTKSYGGPGQMYEFFSYQIEDLEEQEDAPNRFFNMAISFKYACDTGELGRVTRNYIEVVTLGTSRRTDTVEIKIEEFDTPKDLIDLTNSPYMISINKPSHFSRALEILSQKIQDRPLAGYAITELNRSCRSSARTNRDSKCLSYEY